MKILLNKQPLKTDIENRWCLVCSTTYSHDQFSNEVIKQINGVLKLSKRSSHGYDDDIHIYNTTNLKSPRKEIYSRPYRKITRDKVNRIMKKSSKRIIKTVGSEVTIYSFML